jgi:hypothetical protein
MDHVQIVMDRTGDTRHAFSPTDEASVKEAMERFEDLTKKQGHTAAKRHKGASGGEVIRQFDPTAEETLFVPQLKGG